MSLFDPPTIQIGEDLAITGVDTSTAGFIGLVADEVVVPDGNTVAPAGTPQLVTSWDGFKNNFGDIQDGNQVLARAVSGFFNNGGARCWVIRFAPAQTALPLVDAQSGLSAFNDIDDIALVAIPGATGDDVRTAILDHCENASRFAILDGSPTTTLTKAAIRGSVSDSSHGAIYYPWIDTGATDDDGQPVYLPPSGHVAGVHARVEAERGVQRSTVRQALRGAVGIQTPVSAEEQTGLQADHINVVGPYKSNIVLGAAFTLAANEDAEWRYAHTRRAYDYLRRSIDEGTQWVADEQNDPTLWAQIARNVTAFLTSAWSSGVLVGATSDEAFYVRCDETTNTSEIINLGQVVTEIGVALMKPAEFVVFRLTQQAGK